MEANGRLATVEAKIAAACERAGRRRDSVRLLAVSKFHPGRTVAELARAGQQDFGESYVQEAQAKRNELACAWPDLRWHMIGHVQSRKAAAVAGAYHLIHSLDSVRLADALEKHLANSRQRVLIEVNIAEEPQKAGVAPGMLPGLGRHVRQACPHLELAGLMCLPPVFDDGEAVRSYFARLRRLRDELEQTLGLRLPELSMGMSGDYETAIEEGATIVRVGTALFGPRPVKQ